MSYLTDRKRAQGMGSGRQGTTHHWHMMISSVALIVMTPIFILVFGAGFGGTYEEVLAYFGRPFPAIVTGLTLIAAVVHFTSEAKEAVEDYVHGAAQKLTLIGLTIFCYTLIAVGLFALARIAL
ncbi:succinate dehydrogenase, hydrophobic membrane anchor protein [Litoreibacter albidus]|uniref:Succinate dehydrogenase hydrophobic membrane anchor subunit n=1 Tax=Litoreibacter albidus TaxID=670155 RepID=A0A1H2ZH07_9RHOB|nr:succinate dehydrogenase, hydrophobic membrane anchor protein [Litoreibacter albidus]SDX16228.1 succinate dehydrogenase subunit D [Litoreibacter albidus]